jgi:hypothetical protein
MALLPLRILANSPCCEIYETKRLTQLDLLSARIPHKGVGVNGAFNKLKKTREMFWSGRRDLNSGPPAPKAGGPLITSVLFSVSPLKQNNLAMIVACGWPCADVPICLLGGHKSRHNRDRTLDLEVSGLRSNRCRSGQASITWGTRVTIGETFCSKPIGPPISAVPRGIEHLVARSWKLQCLTLEGLPM